MDYSDMSLEQLHRKMERLKSELEGAYKDPTLEGQERYDLITDVRSIMSDVETEISYRTDGPY